MILFLAFFSCKKSSPALPEDTSRVIIEVGDKKLTEKMLYEVLPDTTSKKNALIYSRDWLDLELLSAAAREEGLHEDPSFQKSLAEIERNLLAMTYLNKKMNEQTFSPDENELLNYFKEHPTLFKRREKALEFALFAYGTFADARAAQKRIKQSGYLTEMSSGSADSTFNCEKPVPLGQFSADLGEYLFSIKEGGVTLPKKVGDKIYVYVIKKKYLADTPLTYPEAREEVLHRKISEMKSEAEKLLKEELRRKSNYIHNEEFFKSGSQNEPRSKDSVLSKTGDIHA